MLQPSARAENVVGSVQEYLYGRLSAVFGGLDFGGVPFDDRPLTDWLQVRVLAAARPAALQGPRVDRGGVFGNEMFWILNCNIFVRTAKVAPPNNLRIWTLRDAVIESIAPPQRITVKDYNDDSATIGVLVADELMNDAALIDPDRGDELIGHNIVSSWRWTEAWTVS